MECIHLLECVNTFVPVPVVVPAVAVAVVVVQILVANYFFVVQKKLYLLVR